MPKKSSRSKSSSQWLHEHVQDGWVHKAQQDGYRARSAYKLLEINEKDSIFSPGDLVVDLGSAPGSWSQAVARSTNGKSPVLAMDILPMEPIEGVHFIQGDFTVDDTLRQMEEWLAGRLVDAVICDMAPNMSGLAVTDQARSYYLCELALDFCKDHLKTGGDFLVKVFQGEGFDEYRKEMAEVFAKVQARKPKASRDRSSEVYLLGKNKKNLG